MKPVHHSVRLPVSLDKALRALAAQHGISVYAMLQRSVKAGIAAQANPPPETDSREIVAELASVSTRVVDVERTLDRALFTVCAAIAMPAARRPACARPTRSSRPKSMPPTIASGGLPGRPGDEPAA